MTCVAWQGRATLSKDLGTSINCAVYTAQGIAHHHKDLDRQL
jgi:hypothetical protein